MLLPRLSAKFNARYLAPPLPLASSDMDLPYKVRNSPIYAPIPHPTTTKK